MSRDHSLNLNEQQYDLIRAVADAVQPGLRQQFLAGIQDNLIGRSPLTDADIAHAIDNARNAFLYDDFSDCIQLVVATSCATGQPKTEHHDEGSRTMPLRRNHL